MSKTIIGVSIGNTSSSVAYMKEGTLEVIANQDGERAIPSMLAYAHGDEYYGSQARQQLIRNASNTVGFFRDFLATPFAKIDVSPNHRMAHPTELPDGSTGFTVVEENDGKPATHSVNEYVVRLIKQLKLAAHDYIGKDIDGAVLTVPTDFSEQQRALLADLSTKAGLPVLQVINEPTAALLAHVSRLDVDAQANKLYLLADFGGTRSDCAIVAYNGGIFTILSTSHDPELGGRQLDEVIIEFLAKEFESQYKVDPRKEARAMAKLAQEAELIKKTLSNSTTSQYGVESVASGYDLSGTLNRLRFEVLGRTVFSRITEFVKQAVAKAGIDVLDIDEVVLAGGTSWVPKVTSSVAVLFDESRTRIRSPVLDVRAVGPDELVSRGAAIQGSLVANFDASEIAESLQPIVTNGPHLVKPLGVKLAGDDNEVLEILAANSLVPIRKTARVKGDGPVLLEIVEIEREILVLTETAEPPTPNGDGESDWSDNEPEEFETRRRLMVPGKTLAQLSLKATGHVDIVLTIAKDLRLQIAARSGSEHATGVVTP